MIAAPVVIACCLYLIGERADRIHAQRSGGIAGHAAKGPIRRVSEFTLSSRPVPARGLYRNHTAAYWAGRYRRRTRQLQQARRVLLSSPSVTEALNLAAVVYGNGSTLWALARCESKFDPNARNASGSSGLMQFMPSTFASTPFGGFSIWSPYANALAGGWMLAHGRRSEWVC